MSSSSDHTFHRRPTVVEVVLTITGAFLMTGRTDKKKTKTEIGNAIY